MKGRIRKVKFYRKRFKGRKEAPFHGICRAGVAFASSFGAEVLGPSQAEWVSHQRMICSSGAPCHGGVFLTAKLVLLGGESSRLAVA
eukprot:5249122-Pyramimonas_sp.AAC.1